MHAAIAVNNLDPGRSEASLRPFETDSPVLVYPDTSEPVAGARHLAQPAHRVNLVQLARGGARRRKRPQSLGTLMD